MNPPLPPPDRRRLPVALLVALATTSAGAALTPTEWAHRQEFTVAAPGIVRVELPDATFDAAQPGLADLRLLDPAGRETALLVDQPPAPIARTVAPGSFEVRLEGGETVLTLATGTTQPLAAVRLETPRPRFLHAAKVETSADGNAWRTLDTGLPLFRQWGAEKLEMSLGNTPAARVRIRVSGEMPFTGATLVLAAGPVAEPKPVGARITAREEFAGETVLTVTLDGRHAPLAALELDTPEPIFMRRVTVAVRDVRDLVADERTVGTGTLYRVAVDGAPAQAQLQFAFDHRPAGRELLVHIHNGDSPPLAVTGIRLKRRPISLLFHAPTDGRFTLLSGNPRAAAPRYDLAALAGDLRAAGAAGIMPGPLQDTPGYQPRAGLGEPLPEVPLAGAPFDAAGWTRSRAVQIATAGVQELELDAAALAGTRDDFADLRLLRAGHQIPFILERTALARSVILTPEPVPDAGRPTVSVWRLPLPHPGLPLQRLALASDTPLFERHFRIYEKVTARDGRTYEHTLASGTWHRTPDPGSRRTCVFELGERPRTNLLFLETNNGDNPPITLAGVKGERPVVRLVFKVAETDGFLLAYGNPRAAAPRYDLGLVARQLLTAGHQPARLAAAESDSAGLMSGALSQLQGGLVLWGALALVVLVLLATVAKLLPKPAEK